MKAPELLAPDVISSYEEAYEREVRAGNSGRAAEDHALRNVLSGHTLALRHILEHLAYIEALLAEHLKSHEAGK